MTDDITQPIRDALAAFETANSYRDDKEAVCAFHEALTRSKVIALLARLDAAEKMLSTVKEIVMSELDSNTQAEWICWAIDAAAQAQSAHPRSNTP